MFDEMLRELKKLERGIRIPVQIELDDNGYLDRLCPAVQCRACFKVLFSDWREKVTDEAVFCPICRRQAPSTEWNTPEQAGYIKNIGLAHVQRITNDALRRDARRFNRRQRPGFIQMSMNVGLATRPITVPAQAASVMRQQFTCAECECRYASIGAAFFCPACGHNSAPSTFDRTVEIVRKTVTAVPTMRKVLANEYDDDTAQDSVRQILEDQFSRLVGAFERLAEALFDELPTASQFKRRKNIFQNLADGSSLWKAATGRGYEDMMPATELADLTQLFHKRHVLGHRQGIVDQQYIDRSDDTSHAVGQRLVIREEAVLRLAGLVSTLADELRKAVPS